VRKIRQHLEILLSRKYKDVLASSRLLEIMVKLPGNAPRPNALVVCCQATAHNSPDCLIAVEDGNFANER